MDQYSLESLLSQLETAYFNAKVNYRENNNVGYKVAQAERHRIKDEVIGRFACLKQEMEARQKLIDALINPPSLNLPDKQTYASI